MRVDANPGLQVTLQVNDTDLLDIVIYGVKKLVEGKGFLRRFQFADLTLTEGDVSASVALKRYKQLGEIQIKVFWIRETGENKTRTDKFAPEIEGIIPGKLLKGRAISNRTSLGAPEETTCRYLTTEYPYSKDPIAEFKFKYRTLEELQREGVIPRSPTPIPLDDRDPETLTMEELREALRQNQEINRATQVKIKEEKVAAQRANAQKGTKRKREERDGGDNDDDDDVTVSFQGTRREARRLRNSVNRSEIEVVDLTD